MLGAVSVFVAVKARAITERVMVEFAGYAPCNFRGRDVLLSHCINFHPIAGVQNEGLSATVFPQQTLGFDTAPKTLSVFHIGGMMAQAYTKNFHRWLMDLSAERDAPQKGHGRSKPANAQG